MNTYTQANPFLRLKPEDAAILQEFAIRRALPRNPIYEADALMTQPPGATPFIKDGGLQASSLVAATEYTLIDFTVPQGTVGILKNRAIWFNGAGFIENGSQLRWSVANGDGWVQDEGNLLYAIGPDEDGGITASGGGIVLRPNTRLKVILYCVDPTGLDPAGFVRARIKGWFLPA